MIEYRKLITILKIACDVIVIEIFHAKCCMLIIFQMGHFHCTSKRYVYISNLECILSHIQDSVEKIAVNGKQQFMWRTCFNIYIQIRSQSESKKFIGISQDCDYNQSAICLKTGKFTSKSIQEWICRAYAWHCYLYWALHFSF